MTFSINCLILGAKPEEAFAVEISDNCRNIDSLKTLIAPRFNGVSAQLLDLWKVDFSYQNHDLERLANYVPQGRPLFPFQTLEMFKGEHDTHIHVIVEVGPVLSLNYIIIGDNLMLTVKIWKNENVNILKDMIKEKNPSLSLGKFSAGSLRLWQVDLPNDNLSSINRPPGPELENGALLSEVFPPRLHFKSVHVIVDVPAWAGSRHVAGGEQEGRRDTFAALDQIFENTCNEIAKASGPSVSAKSSTYPKSQIAYSIYDGRYKADAPSTRVAPPIELFHHAFGHFLYGTRDCIPKDIIRNTTEYMQATSATYADEQHRRIALIPILNGILGCNIQVVENNDRTKADGTLEGFTKGGVFLLLLKEDKNEFGDGGSDPSTQAGLSAARSWVQSNFELFRKATACPTFLIANAGPWFAVLGFALTDRVIVQRLTDFLWVGIDSALSRSHVDRVAGVFSALKNSLGELKSYYMNHDIGSAQPALPAPTRYFPSITTYPCKDGHQQVKFKYIGYLESGFDCVTLRAQTESAQDIVVKFVERYSESAHHTLAEANLAPRLLHYGPLQWSPQRPGGSLYMVAMEYIDGDTLASAKSTMNEDMVKRVKSDLKRALTLLHEKDLVFGDLRPPNVMITKEGKRVKLIDFDWAGVAGQVEYPHLLSPAVTWPKGVQTLDPIKKEHDLEMLDNLFAT